MFVILPFCNASVSYHPLLLSDSFNLELCHGSVDQSDPPFGTSLLFMSDLYPINFYQNRSPRTAPTYYPIVPPS